MQLRFVENLGLKSLWDDTMSFSLPSRRMVTRLVQENDGLLTTKLQQIIEEVPFFAMSTDGWTSVANQAYNALIIHGLTENWELVSICLGIAAFDKSGGRQQTAVNLSQDLMKVFSDFSVCLFFFSFFYSVFLVCSFFIFFSLWCALCSGKHVKPV